MAIGVTVRSPSISASREIRTIATPVSPQRSLADLSDVEIQNDVLTDDAIPVYDTISGKFIIRAYSLGEGTTLDGGEF